MKLGNYW